MARKTGAVPTPPSDVLARLSALETLAREQAAELSKIEQRVEDSDQRAARTETKVSEIHDTLMQAKGGWRVLLIGAGIGAGLMKLLAVFWK